MKKTVVQTPNAPKALGPYSQGVVAHNMVFCSGQIGIDPATGKLVEGGVEAQTQQVMANLFNVLKTAQSSMSEVLKCTIYLKDMGNFAKVNEVYGKAFANSIPPARATVEVSRLPMDVDVEIDCIAMVKTRD